MSSVAIIGACFVSCFVSVANPWFYTTTCGRDGCPACHKAANRGRTDAVELGTRAGNNLRTRGQHDSEPAEKKSWFRRRCGEDFDAETDAQQGAASTQQVNPEPSFLGTTGVASRTEQYHGTRPMHIDVPAADTNDRDVNLSSNGGTGETGVSLGVDVSHLAPPPRPVNAAVLDRANADNANDFGGDKNRNKGDPEKLDHASSSLTETDGAAQTSTRTIASEDRTSGRVIATHPSRPLLDEAISWERWGGAGKEDKKRKWWHMP